MTEEAKGESVVGVGHAARYSARAIRRYWIAHLTEVLLSLMTQEEKGQWEWNVWHVIRNNDRWNNEMIEVTISTIAIPKNTADAQGWVSDLMQLNGRLLFNTGNLEKGLHRNNLREQLDNMVVGFRRRLSDGFTALPTYSPG